MNFLILFPFESVSISDLWPNQVNCLLGFMIF